jgi:hypothetical protein
LLEGNTGSAGKTKAEIERLCGADAGFGDKD